jgi:glycosyltransferase involved in cell wall biosynthesis
MVLIDSVYINNSGGKVLLDYLVSELERRDICPFYLFDSRCNKDYAEIPENRKFFMKASLRQRHEFYKKNKKKFHKIVCFGNVPPSIKLKNIEVITYFHKSFFLRKSYPSSIIKKMKTFIQKILLLFLYKNTDKIIVQSVFIKNEFHITYNFPLEKIFVVPFFKISDYKKKNSHIQKRGFVYISNGQEHKNHIRLLKSWELLAELGFYPELGLTIEAEKYSVVNNEILRLQQKGLKIVNYGFTNPYELYEKYEYLIFPSLLETLGLGQVEAINAGCKVVASDLPHTFAVIQPSLVFNPLDVNSIKDAVLYVLNENRLKESKILINNNIDRLISLIGTDSQQ